MSVVAITTLDNPYDPIDDFDKWYMFDCAKGYNTCCLLDRVSYTSNQLSDAENDAEIERAIDEIVRYDPLNMYIKVKRDE